MIEIFALYLITPSNIVEVGRFPTAQACMVVIKSSNVSNAFCKSQYCYRDEHEDKCHVDPLPQ